MTIAALDADRKPGKIMNPLMAKSMFLSVSVSVSLSVCVCVSD